MTVLSKHVFFKVLFIFLNLLCICFYPHFFFLLHKFCFCINPLDKIPSAQLQLWHLSTICLLFCFSREVIILRQWRNPCVLVLLLFWEIHAHVLMAPQHLVTGNTVILLCTSSIACHHKLIVIGSCASYKKGLFNF